MGTTTSDYLDRTLGLGYVKSSIMLLCLVIAILIVWHYVTGKIRVDDITARRDEVFYWLTILVSNTLGTALGDFVASTAGIGFEKGTVVFGILIGLVAVAYYLTKIPQSVLFWSAYILTRPLGATLGDTPTKPHEEGGLQLGRITSSLVIAAAMIVLIAVTSLRRGGDTERSEEK